MLDTTRMLTLQAVAQSGSITAAAASLGYTTSAVSQQISKLEKEAGQPLLERHPRGIVVTEAGWSVVRHAELVRRQLHAAEAELREIKGLRTGTLSIGSFPTAGASLLPLVVKAFRIKHPGVRLKAVSHRFAQLVDALHRRDIEISLLWDYDRDQADDPLLTYHHLMLDPTVVLVSSRHRLAGQESVHIGELSEEAWVTRADDHPVAGLLEHICQDGGFRPDTAFMAHDYGEVQAMVAVELGVAIAPSLGVLNLREDVKALRLVGRSPRRRIFAAHLTDRRLSPAAETAIELCRRAAEELKQSAPLAEHARADATSR